MKVAGNSIVAAQQGVAWVDASLAGMGPGADNVPLEVFIAATDRNSWKHGRAVTAQMDAAEDYGLDTRIILVELGRRKMVGRQEDTIVDVALDLVRAR